MKKKVFGRKLSRSRPAREALFASLARAMIIDGKMVTTKAKAKAVIGSLERFVTLSKKGDLASRRKVLSALDNDRKVTDILFQKIAKAFSGRLSGFVRLTNLPRRKGDNAEMMKVEWTEKIETPEAKKVEKIKEVTKNKDENISTKRKRS